jgi:hypothetical protein
VSLCLALACSGRSTNDAARSPALDYTDPPRSANDGEPIGANRQDPNDTLAGSATTSHLAPGWKIEDGKLRRERERSRTSSGESSTGVCLPDAGAPPVEGEGDGTPRGSRCLEPAP